MNFLPMQSPLQWNGYTPLMDPYKYLYPTAQPQVPLYSLAMYNGGAFQGMERFQDFHSLYPVPASSSDFKELSLKEILDLSEDLLLDSDDEEDSSSSNYDDDDDPLMTTPILEPHMFVPPPILSSCVSRDIVHPITPSNSSNTLADDMENPKKRRRESNSTAASVSSSTPPPRFREYQAGKWSCMFEELLAYKEEHGDACVPYTYKRNRALARWVKRQRYQYRLMVSGQPSTMTQDRANALDAIGFCWDFQASNWMEQLEQLKEFQAKHGHVRVPSQYPENPSLAVWVKCQRRQHTLKLQGKPHNITAERIAVLDQLGFAWEGRSSKKQRV
ncbi:hypothetical protein MPSEU_001053800 [Mayamaea pseudoterrestris]|nr:hypothetical protein MPSEU_001053800 [Mayamaea pseudoterrestris]